MKFWGKCQNFSPTYGTKYHLQFGKTCNLEFYNFLKLWVSFKEILSKFSERPEKFQKKL